MLNILAEGLIAPMHPKDPQGVKGAFAMPSSAAELLCSDAFAHKEDESGEARAPGSIS